MKDKPISVSKSLSAHRAYIAIPRAIDCSSRIGIAKQAQRWLTDQLQPD